MVLDECNDWIKFTFFLLDDVNLFPFFILISTVCNVDAITNHFFVENFFLREFILIHSLFTSRKIICIFSKQWPRAPNLRKWRITHANVSNASHIFPEMTFGECRRVWRVSHGILANLANFKARSFYVQKKKIFLGIKWSSLSSPNSPDSPNSLNSLNLLNTRQIRRSESQKFGEFLASTRIRLICRRVAIA